MLGFEEAVMQSVKHFKPHIIANYLFDLSKEFNQFYASKTILKSQNEKDLIEMVYGVQRILEAGFKILNIPMPDEM